MAAGRKVIRLGVGMSTASGTGVSVGAAAHPSLEAPFVGRTAELEALVGALDEAMATGTPVVLLVMNGRPLDLRWAAENVPAILDIWYPGSRGGAAVANLLLGDVSPGGKLPFSWPRTAGQVTPDDTDAAPDVFQISSSGTRIEVTCRMSSGRVIETSSTLWNWCWRISPRVSRP